MTVTRQYLTPNEWSRPQKKLTEVKAIVMHWTANPKANAMQNWYFFEAKKTGMGPYGSAHYIIGQDGTIIQCMPETEIAYHVGSSQKDPESGKIYTEWARKKFGRYCTNPTVTSPNWCTLGIELCPTDWDGHFSDMTIKSAVDLCSCLCKKHGLTADDITTHHAIVGWKDCPKLWVDKPELFEAFKASVRDALDRGNV